MVNCTALVGTWEWIWNGKFRGKGRNSTKYGYYMLLIIAAARRTRPSQWTWSFNCPLPSNQHWEHGWRTSPGSRYLRAVDIHYHSTKHEVKSQFWIPRSGSVLLCICNRSPESLIKIRFWYLYSDRQTILSRFDGLYFNFGQHLVNKLQYISLCLSGFLSS